jgi:hypothetical protein
MQPRGLSETGKKKMLNEMSTKKITEALAMTNIKIIV